MKYVPCNCSPRADTNVDIVVCRKGPLKAVDDSDPFVDATNQGQRVISARVVPSKETTKSSPRRATRRRVEGTSGEESDRENTHRVENH